MRLKNKFVAVMMVFIIVALIPWIWLSQEYGLTNIPHYNLVMWIFMELYALIFGLIGLGITLIALSDGEEEPQRMKRRSNGNNKKRKPAAEKKAHVKSSEKKPRKKVQKKPDGSYSEDDVKLPAETVEYPAEWDEREFA